MKKSEWYLHLALEAEAKGEEHWKVEHWIAMARDAERRGD